MSQDMPNDDLEHLLERLCLDGLTSDENAVLQSILLDNPDAQRRYVKAVHFREGLAYLLNHEPGASDSEPTGDASDFAGLTGGAEVLWPHQPSQSSPASIDRLRHWIPSWAAAASIAFLAGALIAVLATRGMRDLASSDDSGRRKLAPASSTPHHLLVDRELGKISGLSLEASVEGLLQSMQVGQALHCGEVFQLTTGFVRVQLGSGPELLIEGPAEFSLIDDESVFVRSGRLAAKGGRRLLLQTPLLTAECLDARVSFEAADDDSASIYVSEGVATLMTTPQEEVEGEKIRVLHFSEGLVAEPAGRSDVLRTTARGPIQDIVDQWSEIESRLSEYQQLVLRDRPLAYWPLYQVRKNRRVLDLTQNGHDGLPIGNWPVELKTGEESDDSGRGVYFNGERYIEPDRKPPVNMQNGFAIEGWAKPEGPAEYQAVFTSRWVRDSHLPSKQCYGITLYAGDTDRWEFWTGVGQAGQFWNVMESPQTIDRTSWTHVVGVFTPTAASKPGFMRGVGRLYVNGAQTLEMEQEVPLTDFDWPARIGAAEFVPRYLTSWLFKGYLSDVSIYGYPLEPDRIQEHYKVGEPAVNSKTSDHWRAGKVLLASNGAGRAQ